MVTHQWHRWKETKVQLLLELGGENNLSDAEGIIYELLNDTSIDLSWRKFMWEKYRQIFQDMNVPDDVHS